MNPVIGIDLGTTNTVVAHADAGRAVTLADDNGEKLIPSVVSFHPNGQVLAGQPARERRMVDAASTIYSVKRLIGRTWSSEEVRRARARFPFELREGPGQGVLVFARGQTYTLPEISAHVLRKAKSVAESALGSTVEKAVITVPASFNDLQRAATKVAARVAGLEALRILNEPTAAALAYGYTNATAQKIVVYDFGGGTFDLTLLDLSGNVFEVLTTSGDSFLGGDDIDAAIVERMAEGFLKTHRVDVRTDPQAIERLRSDAERMKITLSALPSATVEVVVPAMGVGGADLSLNFSMSRADLEALIAPLVDRSLEVCQQALGTARLAPGDFEQILLVGGSTRIPLVKRRVAEFFGKDPLQHRHPEEVVALGAAIQAMALTSADRRRSPEGARDPRRPNTLGGLGEQATDARGRVEQDPRAKTNPGVAPADVTRTRPGVNAPPQPAGPTPMTARGVAPPAEPRAAAKPSATQTTNESQPGLAPSTADFGRKTPAFGMAASAARGSTEGSVTDLGWDDITGDSAAGLPLISTGTLPSVKREGSVSVPRIPGMPTKPSVGHEAQQAIAAVQQAANPAGPQIRTMSPAPAAPRQMFPTRTSPQAPQPARADQSVMDMLPLVETESTRSPAADPRPEPSPPPPQAAPAPRRMPSSPDIRAQQRRPAAPQPPPEPAPRAPAPQPTRAAAPPPPAAAFVPAAAGFAATAASAQPAPLPPAAFAATAPSQPVAPQPPYQPPPAPAPAPSVLRAAAFPPEPAPALSPSFPPPFPSDPPPAPAPPPPARGPNQTQVLQAMAMPAATGLSNMSIPGARWAQGNNQLSSPSLSAFSSATPNSLGFGVEVLLAPLCIETVSGYCDVVIPRNTPIPCEKSETFVTSGSNQTSAKIRIAQGNSPRFAENALLGELQIGNLGPAPRGETEITLSMSLGRDGVLTLKARDDKGQEVTHQVTLPRTASALDLARHVLVLAPAVVHAFSHAGASRGHGSASIRREFFAEPLGDVGDARHA